MHLKNPADKMGSGAEMYFLCRKNDEMQIFPQFNPKLLLRKNARLKSMLFYFAER
jgi:hypothetical protein